MGVEVVGTVRKDLACAGAVEKSAPAGKRPVTLGFQTTRDPALPLLSRGQEIHSANEGGLPEDWPFSFYCAPGLIRL
jgi:hypothetical protein